MKVSLWSKVPDPFSATIRVTPPIILQSTLCSGLAFRVTQNEEEIQSGFLLEVRTILLQEERWFVIFISKGQESPIHLYCRDLPLLLSIKVDGFGWTKGVPINSRLGV
jgi:hypothetical protein